jgi:hypothetical protein
MAGLGCFMACGFGDSGAAHETAKSIEQMDSKKTVGMPFLFLIANHPKKEKGSLYLFPSFF